jgi:hypothetical protein
MMRTSRTYSTLTLIPRYQRPPRRPLRQLARHRYYLEYYLLMALFCQ